MNKAFCGLGRKVASIASSLAMEPSGSGGPWGRPFLVMKAKLRGSSPTVSRQSALLNVGNKKSPTMVGVAKLAFRLSIVMAASQCVGSALVTHPGA